MKTCVMLLVSAFLISACEETDDQVLVHDHPLVEHEHKVIWEHDHRLQPHVHNHEHETIPTHTHPTQAHAYDTFIDDSASGAIIVDINPPIIDKGAPHGDPRDNQMNKINVVELSKDGWQFVTITFSKVPHIGGGGIAVSMEGNRFAGWTLEGRVMTIETFCNDEYWPNDTYETWVRWDSGRIYLNLLCPE